MSNKLDIILAEISAGELIDKITILEIKKIKISNKEKLNDIEKELSSLNGTMKKSIPDQNLIKDLIVRLKEINLKLWDIEDGKILKELKKSEGVITALIDQKLPSKLRSIIPSLKDD